MPKLDSFEITIKTGSKGRAEFPKYSINGFPLDFDEQSGGVGPGETFVAKGSPRSFPHSLALMGPSEGDWEIEAMSIDYHVSREEPYTVRFGTFDVDNESDVNIWHEPPPEVFDA